MLLKFSIALLAVVLAAAPALARCSKPGQNVSWYGEPQKLSGGGRFNPEQETCASRTYPRGTILRITDLDTGLGVECAVNDWGPAPWTGCVVDISRKLAERLEIIGRGVARAKIEVRPEPG